MMVLVSGGIAAGYALQSQLTQGHVLLEWQKGCAEVAYRSLEDIASERFPEGQQVGHGQFGLQQRDR